MLDKLSDVPVDIEPHFVTRKSCSPRPVRSERRQRGRSRALSCSIGSGARGLVLRVGFAELLLQISLLGQHGGEVHDDERGEREEHYRGAVAGENRFRKRSPPC